MPPKKVVSEKQLAANRRNAKKSTGPKTTAGKVRARRNSLRHGLLARDVVVTAAGLTEHRADCDAYAVQSQERAQVAPGGSDFVVAGALAAEVASEVCPEGHVDVGLCPTLADVAGAQDVDRYAGLLDKLGVPVERGIGLGAFPAEVAEDDVVQYGQVTQDGHRDLTLSAARRGALEAAAP